MQSIGEILPTCLEQLKDGEIEFIKRKAAQYAEMYIHNIPFAVAYKSDYDNHIFTDKQAQDIIRLTDVYIAIKDGTYTREQGIKKQKEILKKYLSL